MGSPALRAGAGEQARRATMVPMRSLPARLLTAATVLTAVLVGLTGCTSTTYSCSNGSCSITLKGEGASTELDPLSLGLSTSGDVVFTLESADEGAATFSVDGTRNECGTGETVMIDQLSVTCTEITEGTLKLTAASE